MLSLFKKRAYPIGVDIAEEGLYISQLCHHSGEVHLQAGDAAMSVDGELKVGSSQWQKWAVEALKDICQKKKFKGSEVVSSIPCDELIIEHIKIGKAKGAELENEINTKLRQKTGLDPQKLMTKYLEAEDNNIIVLAADKEKVDKYLSIYEKANLQIKSFGVWPAAVTNSYIKFFGRRRSDIESVVMLIDIKANNSYLVICRHKKILFARSIATGFSKIAEDSLAPSVEPLVSQILACRSLFEGMYKNPVIDRAIFFTSCSTVSFERDVFVLLAKKIGIPAQIGNCLTAVEISNFNHHGINRRNDSLIAKEIDFKPKDSWAVAFGLSLSE